MNEDDQKKIEERLARERQALPRRWRVRVSNPGAGRPPSTFLHGCYFPETGMNVTDMGDVGAGEPFNVEWLDKESA